MQTNELVIAAYNLLLNRDPEPAGLQYWSDLLSRGLSNEKLLQSITSSEEFQLIHQKWFPTDQLQRLADIRADLIFSIPNGLKLIAPPADRSIVPSIIDCAGVWEPHITRLIKDMLSPGDIFLDAGANIGYYSILAASFVGRSGLIIAFEPSSTNYEYLMRNIAVNGLTNVKAYKYGLWNADIRKDMVHETNMLGGTRISSEASSYSLKEQIQCVSLDRFGLDLSGLKLIKMDIEGAEPFALEGMQDTLKHSEPDIILEINRYWLRHSFSKDASDIWELLTDLGYKIYIVPWSSDIREIETLSELESLLPPDGVIDILAKL